MFAQIALNIILLVAKRIHRIQANNVTGHLVESNIEICVESIPLVPRRHK